jgi:hypothetical protein
MCDVRVWACARSPTDVASNSAPISIASGRFSSRAPGANGCDDERQSSSNRNESNPGPTWLTVNPFSTTTSRSAAHRIQPMRGAAQLARPFVNSALGSGSHAKARARAIRLSLKSIGLRSRRRDSVAILLSRKTVVCENIRRHPNPPAVLSFRSCSTHSAITNHRMALHAATVAENPNVGLTACYCGIAMSQAFGIWSSTILFFTRNGLPSSNKLNL